MLSRMRTWHGAVALGGILAVAPLVVGPARGQDADPFAEEEPLEEEAPEEKSTDESTPDFLEAVELQRKGKFRTAKKRFLKVLKKYPNTVHKEEIELRAGDNSYLGTDVLHKSGPPSRRVDVAIMGDGFTLESKLQKKQTKWADLVLKVLGSEGAFAEYKDYFNFYFVRLESADEGVDEKLTEEEKEKIRAKNRRRRKKKKIDFNTALDCKAAGPQGQVMSNPGLVFKWLEIAETDSPGPADDGLVIVFAQFGRLGMATMGIANCGHPDNSVTVHEFGHSFAGLADEYTNRPLPPPPAWVTRAPNASTSDDPEFVPWAHWIKKKKKGVGVYEGGATFRKGVWRPWRSGCAMNSAGASGYCPVCREAAVLSIYRTVNPIDTNSPDPGNEVRIVAKDAKYLSVTPMQPRSHDLECTWHVSVLKETDPGPAEMAPLNSGMPLYGNYGRGGVTRYMGGHRHRENRAKYDMPPPGELSKFGKKIKKKKRRPTRYLFLLEKLPPGRYLITALVKDPTKYVLRDDAHLLQERVAWWVTVAPKL